ncbi:uncharacterized protein [Nicotiana sylvestris]|uniref:uncharacterized protein n=1 Tax=Nicotiana sylvestris TaxID=4096 RepID=UPI00388CEA7D
MTYKGKEIIEEVGETGGLTRSGRCYSPEELRKAKQIREGQLPIKKPVTKAEAEEFLKKMKVQDYSIIDQLRKTPAQISLLSLLKHSKEHARVLIKVLNEAHISEETTVNQLEKMANRYFEVNRIFFTDDELLEEEAEHNRALHLRVKCEGHYVKRVMVDGGSSVDVCPLSTFFVNAGFNNMTCMRNSLPDLKKLYVFAWSYDDMPGLSADLVVHKLHTYPDFPPVQQKQRKFKTNVSNKIKEEIMKQLSANVVRAVRYTTWVANVVHVPKKDRKTRVCADYRDLNKESPKDNFPLPNIHILVDNCAKHEI